MSIETPYTCRPIERWPGSLSPFRRRSPFSASWGDTTSLLDRELGQLGAARVVMQLAIRETDIRLDGQPYARAVATHPGVILAFESIHGPLQYAVDSFDHWQANVRAIALALEALRKVDRYGVTRSGEQYRGWRALAAGLSTDVDLVARGQELIADYGSDHEALRATHPDVGGDPDAFRAVQAARAARAA